MKLNIPNTTLKPIIQPLLSSNMMFRVVFCKKCSGSRWLISMNKINRITETKKEMIIPPFTISKTTLKISINRAEILKIETSMALSFLSKEFNNKILLKASTSQINLKPSSSNSKTISKKLRVAQSRFNSGLKTQKLPKAF